MKTVNYSKARAQLRSLIDEVRRSGRPIAILRRGKPEAVVIAYEQFEGKVAPGSKPWRLAGSIRIKPGVDIDRAIEEDRRSMREALEARLRRYGPKRKA